MKKVGLTAMDQTQLRALIFDALANGVELDRVQEAARMNVEQPAFDGFFDYYAAEYAASLEETKPAGKKPRVSKLTAAVEAALDAESPAGLTEGGGDVDADPEGAADELFGG